MKLTIVSVFILLLFNACGQERIVYVNRDCPKLETLEQYTSYKHHKPLDIKYTVVEKKSSTANNYLDEVDNVDAPDEI